MTFNSLKAIAPDLSYHTTSTGTSYYIQQRTALFAKVALICSFAGLAIRGITDTLKGHPELILGSVYLCFGIANVTLLGLWLFTRGKPRRLQVVRFVELVQVSLGLLTASFGFRLSMPGLMSSAISFGQAHPDFLFKTDPTLVRALFEFASLMISLLVATQILAMRAALVPSSLKHSLMMSAFVGLPICIFTGLAIPGMFPDTYPFTSQDRGFLTFFGINWWLFTGAVCGVIAKVVHRLQSEVQVAKRLGQYELGAKIGQGGMGAVFLARHAMMKRPVAIKLLPAEAAGQDAVVRFEREVHLTSQLCHPNTVVIHDYGRTNLGVFYYVMEYIEGATLEQIIKTSGQMPQERVAHVLAMITGSLAEAHEHGLVHRDIKPANILLGPRGGEPDVAKVLDFGLVRTVQSESNVTNAGVLMGTPLFMSPEAIKFPDRVDARSDLYSMGALAYYLLTGHYLFEAESAIEVCAKHIHAAPKPLLAIVKDIHPDLDKLVMACLAKKPEQRPKSAREIHDILISMPLLAEWTPARAKAWWAEHQNILRMEYTEQTAVTGTLVTKS